MKLQHANTGVNLHSHEISYGSGSGQQSVTGYTGGDDANDYWAVRGSEVRQQARTVPNQHNMSVLLCVLAITLHAACTATDCKM